MNNIFLIIISFEHAVQLFKIIQMPNNRSDTSFYSAVLLFQTARLKALIENAERTCCRMMQILHQ